MREQRTLQVRGPTTPVPVSTILQEPYRSLYRLHKKLSTHESHLSFLKTCLRNGLVPKGFTVKNTPTVPNDGLGTLVWPEWSRILHHTSVLLMKTIKQYHQQSIKSITQDIKRIESHAHSLPDFTTTNEYIQNAIQDQRDKLNSTKQTKLSSLREARLKQKRRRRRRRKFPRTSVPSTQTTPVVNTVMNLSGVPLSSGEHSLLEKGLSFCPTPPKVNTFQLQFDLTLFYRRLRLREYFFNEDSTTDEPTQYNPFQLRNKQWNPPKNREHALEAYIQAVDERSKIRHKKLWDNLTQPERAALKSLRNRIAKKEIIIKPADKGSATVVLSFRDYVTEAEHQLNNTNHYRLLDEDPTAAFSTEINSFLEEMIKRNSIDEATRKYLHCKNTRPARFYLLPKIHKPGNPGRPIVASNNAPTEKISQFVDYHLRPLVEKIPSYIKDTTHFLNKLKTIPSLPTNVLLVTLDVKSLYTNIPHEEGITACHTALRTRNIEHPPTEDLVSLISYILKRNNFVFGDKHYLQIHGTAMGTRMAPSYANLFMADLEQTFLQRPITHNPLIWWRYIDDVFAI